ncbi:MAG: hypothetical protein WAS27_01675 [Candidatus Saccharimonadales bacterium]
MRKSTIDALKSYGTILAGIGFYVLLFLLLINFSSMWNGVEAFFAKTPLAKCEAYLSSNTPDIYCKKDGSKGSRLVDKKTECISKKSYFKWNETTSGCERIKYASKNECIADGREGAKQTPDSMSDFYVRCLDDGTWKAYDPEYEDYKAEQAYDEFRHENITTCKDVTTYDDNWNNDMLCANPDGSQFYTDYDGARLYH